MAKEKLNRVRAGLGLTQRTLANLSGVSQPTIGDAEKGRVIQLLTAFAILDALNKVRRERELDELTIDSIDWNLKE